MQKSTVRRTVAAGLLGTAALGVLLVPATANAATPDSIASLANTGSSGPAVPGPAVPGPGVVVTQNPDGTVTAQPGQDWIPATPLQPAQPAPDGVIIQRDLPDVPGSPSHTIIISPAR